MFRTRYYFRDPNLALEGDWLKEKGLNQDGREDENIGWHADDWCGYQ
ncbi:hypothetical protein [Hafnia alvei]|nr:hypothetical protein [Hafnia alvei]